MQISIDGVLQYIALFWQPCWCCCHSSRRPAPPPPSHWARSAPQCSGTQKLEGSPGNVVAMTNVPATTQNNIYNTGHIMRATAQSYAFPVVSTLGLSNNCMFSWRNDLVKLWRRGWVWVYVKSRCFAALSCMSHKHSVFCLCKDTLCHALMRLENSNIHNTEYNELKYTHMCLLIIILKQEKLTSSLQYWFSNLDRVSE